MKQIYLAASVLIAAVAGTLAPAHAQVRNPWNGLYVGLHGGYAWQDVNGIFDSAGAPTLSGIDLNGAIVGGQLGYNWQSGQFLLGIEGDASTLADGDDHGRRPGLARGRDARRRHELPRQHSRPARLGDQQLAAVRHASGGAFPVRIHRERAEPSLRGKQRLDDSGIVYGGGVEWMLAYGVSLRAEYLRYDLGASSPLATTFPGVDPGDSIGFDNIDVARAALNIKLSN